MFPIRAASASNCLIGGGVWDGGGSGAHVFPSTPQLIDTEARLPPSRPPVLMTGFHCPISTATNKHQHPHPLPASPLSFLHPAHYIS